MLLIIPAHATMYNKTKTYPSVGNKTTARGLSTSLLIRILQLDPLFEHTPIRFASESLKYMLPVTQSTARSSGR